MSDINDNKLSTFLPLSNLKYIAIIAMLIDHTAHNFLEFGTPLFMIMRMIGRITGPIMFFSAVEGYHKTKNLKNYILRLLLFAIISQFPFAFFLNRGYIQGMNIYHLNVIFTILFGILAIHIRRTVKNPIVKTISIIILIIISIPADWSISGVLICLIFDYYYPNRKYQLFGFLIWVLLRAGVLNFLTSPFENLLYDGNIDFQSTIENLKYSNSLGYLLPYILLNFYNGQKGDNSPFSKWFFYIFYPTHLLMIGILSRFLITN